MKATQDILEIWRRFDDFPMETITKAWYGTQASECKQRSVELMKEHREQYGTSGNCFDLAIWLLHEFRREDIGSYAILTPDSHVAVIAINEHGNRFLCDLGDQWIEPVLIDPDSEDYTNEFLEGFFPGAQVKVESDGKQLRVTYRRPNGKDVSQTYDLNPVSDEEVVTEGEKTQRTLRSPLIEKRIYTDNEVMHWEFDKDVSFFSSMRGKQIESKPETIDEWVRRISDRSGLSAEIIKIGLEEYARRGMG